MRLDSKVVQPLMNYGIKCKQTKNDLKAAFTAQEREQAQKKKLEQIRQKSPGDRNKLSIAETDLQKASVEASRISKALQEQTDKFEIEKLRDLKVCFCLIWTSNLLIHYKVSLQNKSHARCLRHVRFVLGLQYIALRMHYKVSLR